MSQTTNIESLNSILETVNSLPEAGSGGGGSTNYELCTVTLVNTPSNYNLVWYTIENGEVICKTVYLPASLSSVHSAISVIKGFYIVIGKSVLTATTAQMTLTGGLEIISGSEGTQAGLTVGRVIKVTGDGSIAIA